MRILLQIGPAQRTYGRRYQLVVVSFLSRSPRRTDSTAGPVERKSAVARVLSRWRV
ncbi:hypothetical protein [Pyrinomonas sp.]|uniref:hypothetical protein n=1 Tax=Pyrinomonas sp. TaxID=2080306 RepID=UPI00331E3ED9